MSYVNAKAIHVQDDCEATLAWHEKEAERISGNYLRFRAHLQAEINRRLKRSFWSFLSKSMSVDKYLAAMSWQQRLNRYDEIKWAKEMKHLRDCKYYDLWPIPEVKQLMLAADRILGENKRLADPIMLLSVEDAAYLENMRKRMKA